jgi:hypothetical protein
MEFWLSQSLSHEPFFSRWNSGYHEAFSRIFISHGGISAITESFHEFFFHTMESRLSRSLFTNFSFTRWNLGYHGAFSRFFLSHDGISAITEPFHELFFHTMESRLSRSLFTNFSFTRWNLGYHRVFSRIFLSHDGISAITKPFHELFFHTMESTKCTIWGKTLFIYITKSIYIGSASLKTLPLDLEPPFQGKEYGPSYSNGIAKKKTNFFSPKSLIDS